MSSSSTGPLDHTTLLFPHASTSLSSTLSELQRSKLSIRNRLHSIAQDADFAARISRHVWLPRIVNERCGSWYVPPSARAGSVYFKSTDGHFGQWSFSLRRLNLQILNGVGQRGGYVQSYAFSFSFFLRGGFPNDARAKIDSTRRGKSMPDALSKTVPIWICVLNRLIFPDVPSSHALQTPREVVGESEHFQIEARISRFVADARELKLDVTSLRVKLKDTPMRPVWITPDGKGLFEPVVDKSFHSIVLCTASSRVSMDEKRSGFDYVQGAADDHESWALGLDAETFWKNSKQLLGATETELPSVIEDLIAKSDTSVMIRKPLLVKPTDIIWIANNAAIVVSASDFDMVVQCSPAPDANLAAQMKDKYCHLECSGTAKVGSRQLRSQLPKVEDLGRKLSIGTKILLTCQTGKDLAVGVALAMVCLYFSADGSLVDDATLRPIPDKTEIKQRLSWIMIAIPDASPSRATLQSVNAFLMG
nr:trna a64-2'-o-ribosylphosphate transferase [Quercus suber]